MEKLYNLALAYAPAINHSLIFICLILAKRCGVLQYF